MLAITDTPERCNPVRYPYKGCLKRTKIKPGIQTSVPIILPTSNLSLDRFLKIS